MRNRRGLSEIVSAVIVIAVVVAGMGVYTGLSQQRILGETLTVRDAIQQREHQTSELLEFIHMNRVDDKTAIGIFVHNYGFKNITISDVFVNGTLSRDDSTVYVRGLDEIPITPNNKTIPMGMTSEIVLDFAELETISGIRVAVIQTDSNKLIQFTNETQ